MLSPSLFISVLQRTGRQKSLLPMEATAFQVAQALAAPRASFLAPSARLSGTRRPLGSAQRRTSTAGLAASRSCRTASARSPVTRTVTRAQSESQSSSESEKVRASQCPHSTRRSCPALPATQRALLRLSSINVYHARSWDEGSWPIENSTPYLNLLRKQYGGHKHQLHASATKGCLCLAYIALLCRDFLSCTPLADALWVYEERRHHHRSGPHCLWVWSALRPRGTPLSLSARASTPCTLSASWSEHWTRHWNKHNMLHIMYVV